MTRPLAPEDRAVHYDNGGRPKCGNPLAARSPLTPLTTDPEQVTCLHCAGGYERYDLRPHGTLAAYRRHYRRGEKPCESCRQAKTRDNEDRYRRRRAA